MIDFPDRLSGHHAQRDDLGDPCRRVEIFPLRGDRRAGAAADDSRCQLYEAAKIDGAGPIARFFDVTLPQLRDVLVVIILLRAIWDFKEFDLIFLLTGGGPSPRYADAAAAGLSGGLRAQPDGQGLGLCGGDDGDHAGLHAGLYPPHAVSEEGA
jgi:hypothetical protein